MHYKGSSPSTDGRVAEVLPVTPGSAFAPTFEPEDSSPVSGLRWYSIYYYDFSFSSSFPFTTLPGQRLPRLLRMFAFDVFSTLDSVEVRSLHPHRLLIS